MIEIGLVIAVVMAIGGWLKGKEWYPNSFIPLAIVVLAVVFNLANALLFHGDYLEAGKMAFVESLAAIGIHSGMKNTFQTREDER
ncbi:hypothetical protein [Brevibacillus parabrevis]|uniref:Holin n=1 Tax=Brevibacillus parabrevis TaxID=54914 RepID=A0A4Y3PPI8_BREPA|nr:hypothetical protein [Brevibacillus parabrevis]RNB94450.1 hypothetical protein EDM60_18870 [Brevibacillus parabrevis]GEB35323.1 hypothetical protein BPA01_49030 [Brevibacillus parabrevis]